MWGILAILLGGATTALAAEYFISRSSMWAFIALLPGVAGLGAGFGWLRRYLRCRVAQAIRVESLR